MGRQFEAPVNVLGIECAATCTRLTPLSNAGEITISKTIDKLPAHLWMAVSPDASMCSATGAIGIEFKAVLVSVVVRRLA